MDKSVVYQRVAVGAMALVVFAFFGYLFFNPGVSVNRGSLFWFAIKYAAAPIAIVWIGGRYFGVYLKRMEEQQRTSVIYAAKGGIASIFFVVSYVWGGLLLPYFVAPLYLAGMLVPSWRDSLIGFQGMFVPVPANWYLGVLTTLFWIGLGAVLGRLLYKVRARINPVMPFGFSGYFIVFLFEIFIGSVVFFVT